MRMDRDDHVFPTFRLKPDRGLAAKYTRAQGVDDPPERVSATYMIFLRVLDVQCAAPGFPKDALRIVARVVEAGPDIRCQLASHKEDGTQTAKGEAVCAA